MRRPISLDIFTKSLKTAILSGILLVIIVCVIWIGLTILSVMGLIWMHAHAPLTTIVLVLLPFVALAIGLYGGVILLNRWFC